MTGPSTEPPLSPTPGADIVVRFDRRNVWRTGWVLAGVVALAALAKWVVDDGGSVIFTLIMSMLAAIAMEPAVARLSHRMRRGVATILVMLGVLLFVIVFMLAFGRLLGEQLATFVRSVPDIIARAVDWANATFGASLSVQSILDQFTGGTAGLASLAGDLAGGLIGVVGAVLGAFFSSITFFFFTFYFSADNARLRMWVARLVPPKQQEVFIVAWDLAVIKTGGYVSARLVLAAICGGLSSLFMLIIGMPYWLALGIWTGLVAQFVPTIGTYIAIALPVFVGLVGPEPWQGLALLAFALVYQQIENVTIEPKISAEAVDVHPAVSFAAVMFGAALFGVAGAFVAVPVAALMLALFGIYSRKYDLVPELAALQAAKDGAKKQKRQLLKKPASSDADSPAPATGGDSPQPASTEGV
ncbi:putative PurR-regulated permease PerM [Humibacillus xanthopallidus]|uniref:Putative PurR-regulated permease PerM n=1 Tax=Humibacillus xanthopallidus TaxID=412689 RepID=A0A543PRB2_9MICO|nr:AI-2E family transporter [Humibacillus xanthopallidus]TQN46617.1 putative PurR-regulated permease PerM [Humibacillus xanthopallidus]